MYKYLRHYYSSLVVPDIEHPARSWHPFLLMLVAAASMTLMLNGPFYTALQTDAAREKLTSYFAKIAKTPIFKL